MNTERLIKLIEFLEQLPENQFYFGKVVKDWDSEAKCATAGCAMGWTPVVFPDLVEWIENMYESLTVISIRPKDSTNVCEQGYTFTASWLFDINGLDADALFTPELQGDYGNGELPICNICATAKEVAAMLREFIKLETKRLATVAN